MSVRENLRGRLLIESEEKRIPMNIEIPDDIRKIEQVFKSNGKKLFVVGGSIRDAILGKEPKDWDLATDAVPDDVIRMLKMQSFVTNVIETGKAFGVINALTVNDEYEIATFRKDIFHNEKKDLDSFLIYLKGTDIAKYELFKEGLMK